MNALSTLLWLALAATPPQPTQTQVLPGERQLSDVAKRTLKDPLAAPELKALNGLSADEVKPGTTLKLPGPDRDRALSALAAARNAVAQAGIAPDKRTEALAHLASAEQHLRAARYTEAAKAADAAWQRVSTTASEPTRFAVVVSEDGRTEVASKSGQPVRVEAQGVVKPVYAGQQLIVEKGSVPKAPPDALAAPLLREPLEGHRLRFRAGPKGLGPVSLRWQPAAGAARYEVEVRPSSGAEPVALEVPKPEAKLPPLPAGKYSWWVRAVDAEGHKGPQSAARAFELVAEPMRLEVKGKGFE